MCWIDIRELFVISQGFEYLQPIKILDLNLKSLSILTFVNLQLGYELPFGLFTKVQ